MKVENKWIFKYHYLQNTQLHIIKKRKKWKEIEHKNNPIYIYIKQLKKYPIFLSEQFALESKMSNFSH